MLPVPAFNVINGGSHAGNKLAMQVSCDLSQIIQRLFSPLIAHGCRSSWSFLLELPLSRRPWRWAWKCTTIWRWKFVFRGLYFDCCLMACLCSIMYWMSWLHSASDLILIRLSIVWCFVRLWLRKNMAKMRPMSVMKVVSLLTFRSIN